jgi:hypothetical protein
MISARIRQVAAAVAEWRAQLINIDATNRLLYYRDLRVGTLDLASANPTAVEQLRAGQVVRLGRLFDDPALLLTAQRSVKRIAAKARAAEEEYGVPISFLAAGLATWDDGRRSAPTVVRAGEPSAEGTPAPRRTPVPAAPVLLQAVEFEARPGTPVGYQLTTLGDAFVNPVLVHLLENQFGVEVDEAEVLEAAGDDAMVFELVTKMCSQAEVPGFAVDDRVLIGTFSYLKQPMVEDLDDAQVEFLAANDLVAAIAGDLDAQEAVRSAGGEVSEVAGDYEPPASEFLVLDADASQSYVINAVSAGQHLVVQGPPGTGKSQTIANLIADLVAHGKSVLFVAQKRAAITAVLHRLDLVGLDGLTLDMFEGGGSRKAVVAMLAQALEDKANARSVAVDALHTRWTTARDRLTAHQAALHDQRAPWRTSLWELLAMERGTPSRSASALRVPVATMTSWTSTVDELANAAGELAAVGGNDAQLLERPGWGVDAFDSLDELTSAHQLAEHVETVALPRAHTAVTNLARACGLRSPNDLQEAAAIVELGRDTVETIHDGCAPALGEDVTDDELQRLIQATGSREWRKANGIDLTWGARRAGKKAAKRLFADEVDIASTHLRLSRANDIRARWRAAGVQATPTTYLDGLDEAEDALRRLEEALRDLQLDVQGWDLFALLFDDLGDALRSLVNDPFRTQLPHIHQGRAQLTRSGLGEVVAEMAREALDPAIAEGRVRYVLARSLINHLLSTDERLAGVTRGQLDRWAAEFRAADDEHLRSNALRVRRFAAERLATALNDFPDQHAEIKRQVNRKRGFSSVRRLFHDAPDALVAIKPCWAVSPLMVSQVLPAAEVFDVVIFDEASQVMPADAIPAISRARQIVVAGDRHQLPPTDFFSKLSTPGDGGPDVDEAEDDTEELVATAPETRDVESILDTLDVVLAGRSRTLGWHYRSKDEKLIMTSNVFVYHHQLTTFPGSDSAERLFFEPVRFSTGMGRFNKSPEEEVHRVIDLALVNTSGLRDFYERTPARGGAARRKTEGVA